MYFVIEKNPYSVGKSRLSHLKDTYSLMYWLSSLLQVEGEGIEPKTLEDSLIDITQRKLPKETKKEKEERNLMA